MSGWRLPSNCIKFNFLEPTTFAKCLNHQTTTSLNNLTSIIWPQQPPHQQALISLLSILFFFLVPSIAVKESASLVSSVTIIFMIKEVYSSSPLALFAGWLRASEPFQNLQLPSQCILGSLLAGGACDFFFLELFFYTFGMGLLFYKYTYYIFISFACCLSW